MLRQLLLLNLFLVIVLVAGGLKLLGSWSEFESAHRIESVQPEPEALRTMPAAGGARAAVGDWTEIVTKNPFSFDRNDIAIVAPSRPPVPPQEPPRAPKPVLFGTFGIGDNWQATLASGQAGNRKSRPMKVGETIDGWQIVEIHQNSVVVVSGAFRETVSIDSAIQGPRVSERTVASSVQPAPQTSPSSATVGSPAPVNNASPPLPPPPPGAAKGHWIDTAFGMKWIEDK